MRASGFLRAALVAIGVMAGVPAMAQHTPPPGPYHGHQVVRVVVQTPEQLEAALDASTTAWNCRVGVGPLDLQVTPEQEAALRALGLEPVVLIPDVQALLENEQREMAEARMQRDASWFSTFRTTAELHARLDHWATTYPAFTETFVAGQTLQGRDIKGIRITAPDQPGNPRSERPQVLFNACQHAREWATPMTVMWIGDRVLEEYGTNSRLTNLLDRCEIIIIPVVNCDGYEFSWGQGNRLWRKNRRPNPNGSFGVDTNRNWGYQWGGEGASTNQNNDTFRGAGPFSEPETQVMRDFITANPRIGAHIDFHSYSQLILSPWGYTRDLPAERPILLMLEEDMQAGIASVHGQVYVAGPSYTTIYPASGVAPDWVYGDRGIPSFTYEVRDRGTYGFVMPVAEIIPNAEENFEGAIRLAEQAVLPLLVAGVGQYPTAVTASAGAPVAFAARSARESLAPPPTMRLRVNDGEWTNVPMTFQQGSTYGAMLPAVGCGTEIEYYFEARTTAGTLVTYPAGGASDPLRASGVDVQTLFFDDMESDRGWTGGLPGDTATLGIWSRCDPEGTAAQPEDDATPDPGVLAWITDCRAGSGVGAFDVDNGITTLLSPMFSAVPDGVRRVRETRLGYARWYSNNMGASPNADSAPVEISNDNGQTWVMIEDVTENAGAWVRKTWRVEDFVQPTSTMRFRYVARDLGAGSIVEAGLDDFFVEVLMCPPDLDYNGDGNVDQDDVECLAQAVAGDGACAVLDPDFNGDGNVDQDDIIALMIAVGGG